MGGAKPPFFCGLSRGIAKPCEAHHSRRVGPSAQLRKQTKSGLDSGQFGELLELAEQLVDLAGPGHQMGAGP